jgi:hypothetical protein
VEGVEGGDKTLARQAGHVKCIGCFLLLAENLGTPTPPDILSKVSYKVTLLDFLPCHHCDLDQTREGPLY